MVPFESLCTVCCSPSIVTMALCCLIAEKKRELLENRDFFSYRLTFDAPVRGSSSEYCHTVRYGKTWMVWLFYSEKSLRIYLAVSTEYRRVTDSRTGRRTDRLRSCYSIVRAVITSRAVKTPNTWLKQMHQLTILIWSLHLSKTRFVGVIQKM